MLFGTLAVSREPIHSLVFIPLVLFDENDSRDSIRSLVISQQLLGTREIAVIHHTDCGMVTFTTENVRKQLKEANPGETFRNAVDQIDFLEFSDWEESVKEDIKFLRAHPLLIKDTVITGWVYHVETGKVQQVV